MYVSFLNKFAKNISYYKIFKKFCICSFRNKWYKHRPEDGLKDGKIKIFLIKLIETRFKKPEFVIVKKYKIPVKGFRRSKNDREREVFQRNMKENKDYEVTIASIITGAFGNA